MNTTNPNTAVAAPLPTSMYNRGEQPAVAENVMQSIHSLKLYNAAPGGQEDPQLAGKLLIKSPGMDKYEEFGAAVSMNILKIRKALNGQYNILDINGQPEKDNNGDTKKGFAFTEEYMRFSRNTTEIFFKDNESGWVVRETIGNLKSLFKAKEINGQPNRFYKVALDQNNIPYDSTFMRESYVIYGVFTDGQHAGEYFRLFMSAPAFGNKWDAQTKTSTIAPGSLAAAIEDVRGAFEQMKTTQGIDGYFDDSLIVTTLSSVKEGNFFKPRFTNNALVTKDNTPDYDFITELEATYKEQTFNTVAPRNAQIEGGQWVSNQIAEKSVVNEQPVENVQQPVNTTPPANQGYAQPQGVNNPTNVPAGNTAPAANTTPVNNTAPVNNQNTNTAPDEGISIEDIPF